MNKYKIIAICGKSAVGKDTMLQGMLEAKGDNVHEVISHTTRPPREGEVDGKHYHFISRTDFAHKNMCGQMLETAMYRDWHYGTAIDALDKNKINIGVFNRRGIESLLSRDDILEVYVVYMLASDKQRLLRSLNRETDPDVKEIVRRYLADEEEWQDFHAYNFIIGNDGQGVDPARIAAITERIIEEAEHLWAKETN